MASLGLQGCDRGHASLGSTAYVSSMPSLASAPARTIMSMLPRRAKASGGAPKGEAKAAGGAPKGEEGEGRGRRASARPRAPSVYTLVKEEGIRCLSELQELAQTRADAGDTGLAEFLTKSATKIPAQIEAALAITTAKERAAAKKLSLVDKLKKAAAEKECICWGRWRGAAEKILTDNGFDPVGWTGDVCQALLLGAKRGVNLGIVGKGGCPAPSFVPSFSPRGPRPLPEVLVLSFLTPHRAACPDDCV